MPQRKTLSSNKSNTYWNSLLFIIVAIILQSGKTFCTLDINSFYNGSRTSNAICRTVAKWDYLVCVEINLMHFHFYIFTVVNNFFFQLVEPEMEEARDEKDCSIIGKLSLHIYSRVSNHQFNSSHFRNSQVPYMKIYRSWRGQGGWDEWGRRARAGRRKQVVVGWKAGKQAGRQAGQ